MKIALLILFSALLAGCSTIGGAHKDTQIVAVVRSYEEVIPLGTREPTPNYFSISLDIISPAELGGAELIVRSKRPLRDDHPLHVSGTKLNLLVRDLQAKRGSTQNGDGQPWRVCFSIDISDLTLVSKSAEKPNQSPEPTPLLVTPRAGARVAPSKGVAHL